MLQKLNERIQGVVAWVIIVLIAITFAFFGIDYYMQSRQDTGVQVEVNGQIISKQAVEMTYRRARQFDRNQETSVIAETRLKQDVVNDMIKNAVSVQAANASGFDVSINQANAAILGIPQFQEEGKFSTNRYQQALNGAYFTPETFQKEVRQGMLLNQQRFAFVGTAFALPGEVERFVKLYMQSRDFDYLEIPVNDYLKNTTLSEEDINQYYKQHKKTFMTDENVVIDYILLSMDAIKKTIKPTTTAIQRYYNENKANYNTPAQWQVSHLLLGFKPNASLDEQAHVKNEADALYQTLQANPDLFEEKAKALSADKIASMTDASLPWITAGQTPFDAALIQLKKAGDISTPVKSKHGYELFKLVAYKPAHLKLLDDVRPEIESQLILDQALREYTQALERLTDLSYETPDSLKPVAAALKLPINQSLPFSKQGGAVPLTKNSQVINAAFSQDVLSLGNNSEPIQVDNDTVMVLRVNKHIPARIRTLSEVRHAIVQTLTRQKATDEVISLGNQFMAMPPHGAEEAAFLSAHHLKWRAIDNARRDTEQTVNPKIELAFRLPASGSQRGEYLQNGNYLIVRLKSIHDGRLDSLDKEQQASMTEQLEANAGLMEYDLYVSGLLKKAIIVKQ